MFFHFYHISIFRYHPRLSSLAKHDFKPATLRSCPFKMEVFSFGVPIEDESAAFRGHLQLSLDGFDLKERGPIVSPMANRLLLPVANSNQDKFAYHNLLNLLAISLDKRWCWKVLSFGNGGIGENIAFYEKVRHLCGVRAEEIDRDRRTLRYGVLTS